MSWRVLLCTDHNLNNLSRGMHTSMLLIQPGSNVVGVAAECPHRLLIDR
jgi:hypothetical protein